MIRLIRQLHDVYVVNDAGPFPNVYEIEMGDGTTAFAFANVEVERDGEGDLVMGPERKS